MRPLPLRVLSLLHLAVHRLTAGRYGSTEPGRQAPQGRALELITKAHVRVYRMTSGLIGSKAGGLSTLLLTTTGRKTGLPRTVALPYFDCGGTIVVVASFAGNDAHPAWYTNLVATPQVALQIKGKKSTATARTARGQERAALWNALLAQAPFYADYQAVTAREIPVVVLAGDY